MGAQKYKPTKLFTVEQANAMMPLVRAITTDMVELAGELLERQQRLEHLTSGRNLESDDPYRAELVQIKEELQKDMHRLDDFANELRQLGVEPKDPTKGLVDFPSMMDGRLVFLCWKLGEPEVLFWHDLDAGYSGRQPLIAAAVSSD